MAHLASSVVQIQPSCHRAHSDLMHRFSTRTPECLRSSASTWTGFRSLSRKAAVPLPPGRAGRFSSIAVDHAADAGAGQGKDRRRALTRTASLGHSQQSTDACIAGDAHHAVGDVLPREAITPSSAGTGPARAQQGQGIAADVEGKAAGAKYDQLFPAGKGQQCTRPSRPWILAEDLSHPSCTFRGRNVGPGAAASTLAQRPHQAGIPSSALRRSGC